jgi:NADH dehydrogenase FAD-containing subunit
MKKLVIIGGGFAGSIVAKLLESRFNVVLIDTKSFFEFTPSVLRTIVVPNHIKKIQIPHRSYLKKSKIIVGEVSEVSDKFVKIRGKKISFDYLIVTSGSSYSLPIKEKNIVNTARVSHLKKCYNKLLPINVFNMEAEKIEE